MVCRAGATAILYYRDVSTTGHRDVLIKIYESTVDIQDCHNFDLIGCACGEGRPATNSSTAAAYSSGCDLRCAQCAESSLQRRTCAPLRSRSSAYASMASYMLAAIELGATRRESCAQMSKRSFCGIAVKRPWASRRMGPGGESQTTAGSRNSFPTYDGSM